MTTTIQERARHLIGRTAVDPDGDKIGTIESLYVDDVTGEPEWIAVSTGWFGTNVTFVPIDGCTEHGDDVRLAHRKDVVKDAPNIPVDGHIDEAEERRLYAHYGRQRRDTADSDRRADANRPDPYDDPRRSSTSGRSAASGSASGGEAAMTRSEEQLDVGRERRPVGRARLHKWVETEHVQTTVPVTKEKARLVTEPVDSGTARGTSGKAGKAGKAGSADLGEDDREITLSEEQITVDKKVVPKEKVRLEKETTTEHVDVDETLRKERVDVRDDGRGSSGGRRR